jgi:hypothetical protein
VPSVEEWDGLRQGKVPIINCPSLFVGWPSATLSARPKLGGVNRLTFKDNGRLLPPCPVGRRQEEARQLSGRHRPIEAAGLLEASLAINPLPQGLRLQWRPQPYSN